MRRGVLQTNVAEPFGTQRSGGSRQCMWKPLSHVSQKSILSSLPTAQMEVVEALEFEIVGAAGRWEGM